MTRSIVSLVLVIAGLGPLAAPVCAQVICWDDENGRRVCGDRLPPDQATRDREILNDQGVIIRRERGEIPEEERAEAEAEARAREARARQAAEEARYNQVLLDSYTSVESIEAVRDRTIADMDSQINLMKRNLESLHAKLDSLNTTTQRYAPYSERENAPPVPENITRDIEATKSSIALFESRLENSLLEREETLQDFERDIVTFRELQHSDG